jgi:hypothetical protein
MSPDDPRHGSDAGYVAENRAKIPTCAACKEAHRRKNVMRQLRPHKVSVTGSRRRIQALQRLGYSRDRIAHEMGYTDQGALTYIMHPNTKTMLVVTAAKIARVYDKLSMTVPTGRGATRARTWAIRNGYAPPLAWDDIDNDPRPVSAPRSPRGIDEAVVERVLAGEHLPTSRAEKDEITRRWRATGRPTNDLERLFGWKPDRYDRRTA